MNGRFPFSSKFRKFQLEQGILVLRDRNIWDHGRDPLLPVCSFRSVRPKCPSPFDNIAVPSTPFLFPAHKLKRTMAWVDRVCATWNVPFHWARGISEISNRTFCWLESAQRFRHKESSKNQITGIKRRKKMIEKQDEQAFRIEGNYWKIIFYKTWCIPNMISTSILVISLYIK